MGEKIALGFCNNIDYEIVWDAATLEGLVREYGIRADELRRQGEIRSERDLLLSILGFMQRGEGGERFVADSGLIERFASRFDKKITLGGTSVRAAIAMGKLGASAALHLITQNDQVRRLLPAGCPWVCSNRGDSHHPHLIAQFGLGDRVRAGEIDIRARQANRLIYHCNADRIAMKINPAFSELAAEAGALLISGFNAMQDRRLLESRLEALEDILARLPTRTRVFLEDGGFYDASFRQSIYRALGSRLDIFSLNEDELQAHLGRRVNLRDEMDVGAAVAELHGAHPAATVVLHTRHWALAHGENAEQYRDALRAGVNLATTRFSFGDDCTPADHASIAATAPHQADRRFAAAITDLDPGEIACAPVPAVDQRQATTIGLGDAFVGGFLSALVD